MCCEFLTGVTMKISLVWGVTHCSSVEIHRPDKGQKRNISLKMEGDEVLPKRER
jgi:hypothetical protein